MHFAVLIIDDNQALRGLLAHYVGARGYAVHEAGTLEGAREVLASHAIDVVVVGPQLSDGVGIDFVAELRGTPRGRGLPLIYLAAKWLDRPTYDRLVETLAVSRVIIKPFSPEEFLIQLEATLAMETADDEAAISTDDDPTPLDDVIIEAPPPMPADSADELGQEERELAQLRAEYVAELRERLEQLKAMLAGVHQGAERGRLERGRHLAHEIRGTAGTFGYMEVSAAAAVVDDALADILAGALDAGDLQTWRHIDAALERADAAASSGAPTVEDPLGANTPHATRLLVVDEDPDFLASIQRLREGLLTDVLVAQSEQRAATLARAYAIDGVIIDLSFGAPETCFRLARQLREIEGLAELPVAFVSAQGKLPDRVAAAHAGATCFLTKPLSAEDLALTGSRFAAIRHASPIRVTVIDPDPSFVDALGKVLEAQQMTVTQLERPERILEHLDAERPDLLLLETLLPRLSGYDLCRLVRSTPRWQHLPLIFLTAQSSRRARLACFEAGGDDYLEKPVLMEELLARVRVRVERIRVERAHSDRDPLTGLLRRPAFLREMEGRLAENRRRGRPLSLALIALETHDPPGQRHSPQSEDRVLEIFGALLRRRFRTEDLRCRWGGDHFIVAFNGEKAATSRLILDRALAEFTDTMVEVAEGQLVNPRCRVGIAGFPADGATFGELLGAADDRLNQGR